jgi:hypothetical protein
MDNSFGGDGIVFSLNGLPGGPFNSAFAGVQYQARGLATAIYGTGIGNGLPYTRFVPSFFATFGNGSAVEHLFGTLAVSLSAAPEPSTWAAMLAGFAVVGSAMRRRRFGMMSLTA